MNGWQYLPMASFSPLFTGNVAGDEHTERRGHKTHGTVMRFQSWRLVTFFSPSRFTDMTRAMTPESQSGVVTGTGAGAAGGRGWQAVRDGVKGDNEEFSA